jgi:hypothetical protein
MDLEPTTYRLSLGSIVRSFPVVHGRCHLSHVPLASSVKTLRRRSEQLVVGKSAGARPGSRTLVNTLRDLHRSLGGWVIPRLFRVANGNEPRS